MASLATTRSGTPSSGNKQIPLLCTVCPEAPRFSDVSHLLTHIASKGHLHHETQTRLKSHQDIAATVALQQYEHWYKDNGIEALLVDRMRAKQLKEAARNRRARGTTPTPALKVRVSPAKNVKGHDADAEKQTKRKAKRSANSAIKAEQDDFNQDFPLFPGFFPSDNEAENQDDFFVANDMLSLKGQVWPGMGKMDLANEDMKRTRNQRKPNSVIEKMRRTSEGIEPTQVVMTSDFEVERIKGVYDSSSPIPGQEEEVRPTCTLSFRIIMADFEETPKKVAKPKRKRNEALAEISANVPRGGNRRSGRHTLANGSKRSQLKLDYDRDTSVDMTPSLGAFRHGHDVFRDDDGSSGLYDDRSPTQPETPYGLNDASMYDNSARLSFSASSHFNTLSQDSFRLNPSSHLQPKHEDYSASTTGDSLSNSTNNQFLTISESNPLFSQDRLFLSPYSQSSTNQHLSSLAFTPINRGRDRTLAAHHDQEQRPPGANIKLEAQFCEGIDNGQSHDSKHSSFTANGIWDSQGPETGVELHEDLDEEQLDM
ncbi:Uncharacterized protein TCAP_05545 [Tolypocladium capitatum]|uniref:Uncharacterized protein n=1 Tax=Tolypocladium capitatum TaxID=45235 RepID=A0A2K3QAJ4_9HYPO|nr:Uncharacterized protein TCAP_05545 [Tolypocladium capitatum]